MDIERDDTEAWVFEHKLPAKITRENIAKTMQQLSVYADYELRGNSAIIRVQHDTGTGMYFAKAGDEFFWLKQKSFKNETKGNFSIYHIKLEE